MVLGSNGTWKGSILIEGKDGKDGKAARS